MWRRWGDLGLANLDSSQLAFHQLRREMERLFNDYDRAASSPGPRGAGVPTGRVMWPRVSLIDAGQELRLRAEVPGMSDKDLQITVEQNSLTIRGERQADAFEGYSVHRRERAFDGFARSFALPCRIDADQVTARLSNGVLEMVLPKASEERPRQIQVSAA